MLGSFSKTMRLMARCLSLQDEVTFVKKTFKTPDKDRLSYFVLSERRVRLVLLDTIREIKLFVGGFHSFFNMFLLVYCFAAVNRYVGG